MELRRGRASFSPKFSAVLLSLSLSVGLGAGLSACSSPAVSRSTTTSTTIPGGVRLASDGTATVAVRSLPSNFNPSSPAGATPVTQMVMQQVWPQPFVTDPTFQVALAANFLTSVEVQGLSPLKVVYQINPKAVWSDGVPISVLDFRYDWRQQLRVAPTLPFSGLVTGYRDIASITGTNGGKTVTVIFHQDFSQWESLFGNLVPSHIAEAGGWSKAFADFSGAAPSTMVSGGPFEIASVTPGKRLVLVRNPEYWGPPARLQQITFLVERTSADAVSAVVSGAASLAEVASAASVHSDVVAAGLAGRELIWTQHESSTIWQICFNFHDDALSAVGMRRALAHSLDRSEILADSGGLTDWTLPVAASRLSILGEQSGGEGPLNLYRPLVALGYFRQAGYRPGAGGLLRFGGTGAPLILSIVVPADQPVAVAAGGVVQAELRAIGVVVRVVPEPLARMLAVTLPGATYQMAIAPYFVSSTVADLAPLYTDPVSSSGVAGSQVATATSGPTNPPVPGDGGAVAAGVVTRDVLGYSDPYVAEQLAAAQSNLDPAADASALAKADVRMWNQVVTIPLFQQPFDTVQALDLLNVSESPTWAGVMWNAQDWAIQLQPAGATSTTTTTTTALASLATGTSVTTPTTAGSSAAPGGNSMVTTTTSGGA